MRIRPKPNSAEDIRRYCHKLPIEALTWCRKQKGDRMSPDGVALAAIVILIFPMGYFFLASPAFLLVTLDIPPVTQLLRGMFNAHFLMVSIAGVSLAFAVAGRLTFAIGVGLIAAFAVWARRGVRQQMDAELSAKDTGDA